MPLPRCSLVLRLRVAHALVDLYWALLWTYPSGCCCWSYLRPLYSKLHEQEVFILSYLRIYLVILNILMLGATAPLQVGGVLILFIFRGLQGVVCGIAMNFIPTYISELVPKELGSRFGVYPQLAVVMGVLIAYITPMAMQNAFHY